MLESVQHKILYCEDESHINVQVKCYNTVLIPVIFSEYVMSRIDGSVQITKQSLENLASNT